MRYGKELGSALLYGVVSSMLTFANKALPSTFDFNYPMFIMILQMVLMQVVLVILNAIGTLKYPAITLRGIWQHIPVSVTYSLNATVALAALQAVSIPTYGVLKRAGPVCIPFIYTRIYTYSI